MKSIQVQKTRVLEVLRNNRVKHRDIFLEACEGYRKKATEELDKLLSEIKQGRLPVISIVLPLPEDHTREYDRAIGMLEMSMTDIVELTEEDYKRYVQDDWTWKRQFLMRNTAYGSRTALGELEDVVDDEM